MTLLQRDPVIETLKSNAAYDTTTFFLWLFAAVITPDESCQALLSPFSTATTTSTRRA